uniref:Uncharacterized protein n=1 Tax=Manihot esculenta TaxID=3983 RepID=A0A2C9VHG0_MANES
MQGQIRTQDPTERRVLINPCKKIMGHTSITVDRQPWLPSWPL